MTFTNKVEINLDGTWTDITSYVRSSDRITATRGRSDEGTQVERSTCKLTLNNYGLLGRNTQLRVSTKLGPTRLLAEASTDYASTPDHASISITGDIDIRIDAALRSWRAATTLIYKASGASQKSYTLQLNADGTVSLVWSTTGANDVTATSTAVVPPSTTGRKALRATLDVNNGSGGYTVTFYTSDTLSGSWTQLGDAITTTSGTTSIFDSTAELRVDASVDHVVYYGAEVRSGIGGSAVANPDFTAQTDGATSFTDGAGRTWTLQASAELTTRHYRFIGEVSAWQQKWDTSGSDVYTPIEASGIMRRLGQGSPPLKSALYRALTTLDTAPVAYWPAEDEDNSTSIASGLSGHPPMEFEEADLPDFAANTEFVASAALPTIGTSKWTGEVLAYTSTGTVQMRFLMKVPDSGGTDGEIIAALSTQPPGTVGGLAQWAIKYHTGGNLRLEAYATDGSTVVDSGSVAFGVNGVLLYISLELAQSGSDINWALKTLEVGASSVTSTSGTKTSATLGAAQEVYVNHSMTDFDTTSVGAETVIGHISVHGSITSLTTLADLIAAYAGEAAGTRIQRLCDEEGITLVGLGDLADTEPMGPQGQEPLLELIREAAAADLGILYEPRDTFGLAYRTRVALYAERNAVLGLDYDSADMSSIEPVNDDQNTRNDITVARKNGSSHREVLDTGALSTQSPPDGVGRYADSVTVNVEADTQLPDQAGWRLHAGTVDEARYPVLGLHLARSVFTSTRQGQALTLDLGDRLDVTDPPAWLPPDDIRQTVQGSTEVLDKFEYAIAVNCSPYSIVSVGVYGSDRYSGEGSTLAEDLTTTETDVDVATPSGPLWTTASEDLPFNIRVGGEVMTVTAVSGASSPQTFTVTRSVNGVVKAHSSGATVELDPVAVYAL
jgi:hypothetical protein